METREERQVMIVALRREIASAESSIASLKAQAAELEDKVGPGAETRVLKVAQAIKEQEKAARRAGEELALRVGGGVAKRGPGRPPSKPADQPRKGE